MLRREDGGGDDEKSSDGPSQELTGEEKIASDEGDDTKMSATERALLEQGGGVGGVGGSSDSARKRRRVSKSEGSRGASAKRRDSSSSSESTSSSGEETLSVPAPAASDAGAMVRGDGDNLQETAAFQPIIRPVRSVGVGVGQGGQLESDYRRLLQVLSPGGSMNAFLSSRQPPSLLASTIAAARSPSAAASPWAEPPPPTASLHHQQQQQLPTSIAELHLRNHLLGQQLTPDLILQLDALNRVSALSNQPSVLNLSSPLGGGLHSNLAGNRLGGDLATAIRESAIREEYLRALVAQRQQAQHPLLETALSFGASGFRAPSTAAFAAAAGATHRPSVPAANLLNVQAALGRNPFLLDAVSGRTTSVAQPTQQQWQRPRPLPQSTAAAARFPLSLPAVLMQEEDSLKLSSHQVLLRQQIEAFQATEDDVSTHTRGRNKPISLGQVGIRCRHCARLPVARRQKGSTYFPATLMGLYQAAQNMSTTHLQCTLCTEMPDDIKQQFQLSSVKVASSGAGRPYWAQSAKKLGLVDTEEDGIRFIGDLPGGARIAGTTSDAL